MALDRGEKRLMKSNRPVWVVRQPKLLILIDPHIPLGRTIFTTTPEQSRASQFEFDPKANDVFRQRRVLPRSALLLQPDIRVFELEQRAF